MIRTVLFDMDGLLLDTEPLWGESMIRVAHANGIPVTETLFRATTGLRIYEVTDYWAHAFPWKGKDAQTVAEDILDDIIDLAKTKGRIMPGAKETLSLLRSKGIQTAVASSSPERMIHSLIDHFDLRNDFDLLVSADAVGIGKPHPAVFLHAATLLNSSPAECLVLEDSLNGMIAAKAARMRVVVVPEERVYEHGGFSLADAKLKTLEDFPEKLLL